MDSDQTAHSGVGYCGSTLISQVFLFKFVAEILNMVDIFTCFFFFFFQISLKQMRAHLQTCDKIDRSIPVFHPVQPTAQRYPR